MEIKKRTINPGNRPGPKGSKSKMITLMVDDLFFTRLCKLAERKNSTNSEILRSCFDCFYAQQEMYDMHRMLELKDLLDKYEDGHIDKNKYEKLRAEILKKDY